MGIFFYINPRNIWKCVVFFSKCVTFPIGKKVNARYINVIHAGDIWNRRWSFILVHGIVNLNVWFANTSCWLVFFPFPMKPAVEWILQHPIHGTATLAEVIAIGHQATSHYLNQCQSRSTQCSRLSWKSCQSWSEFWEIQTLICKEMCKKLLVLTKSCRSRTHGPALVSNTGSTTWYVVTRGLDY